MILSVLRRLLVHASTEVWYEVALTRGFRSELCFRKAGRVELSQSVPVEMTVIGFLYRSTVSPKPHVFGGGLKY